MRYLKSTASAAVIAVACTVPSVASAMSLQEAAGITVQTNPQMTAAQENRRAQVYELRQGRGLYLPSVDLSLGAGPEWTETRTINPSKTMPRYDSQLRLTQLLFDGFGREAKIEQRAARLDAAALRVAERAEALSLDAAEVYLDVLRNQGLVRIAEENVVNHEETLAEVTDRVEAGQTGIGDQQQAQVRLTAAREALVRAEQDRDDAVARFIRIVGVAPEDLEPAPSVTSMLPSSGNEAAALAVRSSPAVASSAAQVDEAVAQHRDAASPYYPTVNLELTGSRNRNVDGTRGMDNDASAMVRVTWNLYRGGIDTARRTELAHRIGESRAQTMDLERSIAEEARLSWNALQAARRRVEILSEQVVTNAQVTETYSQEFQIGQRDLLDLLDSENELFLSRSDLLSAEQVAQFAEYRLLAVMGKLTEALNVAMPGEAATGARQDAGVTPDYTPGSAMKAGEDATAAGE